MSDTMNLRRSVRDRSDETEFYTPLPEGYTLGLAEYVAVVGTVMSGLGKGNASVRLLPFLGADEG